MAISRNIFRQYDIRGVTHDDLTTEAALAIGDAYARHIRSLGRTGTVVVGRDNRPSGGALRDSLVEGLTKAGVDVLDIGVVPTPVMYWTLSHAEVVGGIQITGSHNPPEYNGFKMCVGTDSLHGDGIQRLYQLTQEQAEPAGRAGSVRSTDVLDQYIADILERTGPLARRLKVVIDSGNGAGALVAPKLFSQVGIDATCIFCESDGTFPNHHPDPTVVENLHDLIETVKREKADLGIAFDGDADRIGVVDSRGEIIWGDHLLILYARDVFARTGADQPIIFDVKCSQALPDAIEAAGGRPVMWKTGHSLIKEKMKELRAPLAGEMSGHMFFSEGFYGHDDAVYAAARLLRIVAADGRAVHEMLSDVPKFVSTPEIRVDCPDDLKFDIVDRAVAHFSSVRDVVNVDGARVLYGDGWGLIRASNTQPVLVMRFEALTEERLGEIRRDMEAWLEGQGVRV